MILYFLIIYLSLLIISCISARENTTRNEISVHLEYTDTDKQIMMLSYNLSSNYSYYLTFRLFEHEQMKFGLYPSTSRYQEKILPIMTQLNTSRDSVDLFIICFHFIHPSNDLDIQCKDIRLFNSNESKSEQDYLPTYKPLFVPLMYALSILMLLPVIIQHRRQRQAQLLERRKELRRLSLTISPDNPNLLSHIVEVGNINFKKIPIQIELVSLPSTKTMLDDIDDNDNVTFKLQKLRPFIDKYDDEEEEEEEEEPGISADDCIAHLLDSTPWNSYPFQQSPMISSVKRESNEMMKEHHIPMIPAFYDHEDDDDDDKRPILKSSNAHYKVDLFRTNPTFTESDV